MNQLSSIHLVPEPALLERVLVAQRDLQSKIRSISENGLIVEYDNLSLKVLPDVFIPLDESKALTDNFVIEKGSRVLDVCTGSGVIALSAASKGAGSVVGLDINPAAVECTAENVARLGFSEIVDVRLSDVYGALADDEVFDVITANPPFLDLSAPDAATRAFWDENLYVQRQIFKGLSQRLAPNGRAYLCQTNIGPLDKLERIANEAGFKLQLLADSPLFEEIPEARFIALEIFRA
jgi:release factor glutamine methyltransferase